MVAMSLERHTDGIMAKKKAATPGRFNPREAGRQTLEIAVIQQMLADCRIELADMDTALIRASEHQLTAIETEGATKLERALELLAVFAANLDRGVRKTYRARPAKSCGQNPTTVPADDHHSVPGKNKLKNRMSSRKHSGFCGLWSPLGPRVALTVNSTPDYRCCLNL